MKIDFVLTWVDDKNVNWKTKKASYENHYIDVDMNGEERYRSSLRLLELWIAGAKKYASWVNKIFIIIDRDFREMCAHLESDKVTIVCHDEFMPLWCLPTFNSNVIELNIQNIANLSECFVLFNDDCFIVNKVSENDFFDDNQMPVDVDDVSPINMRDQYGHILLNNIILINSTLSYVDYRKKLYRTYMKKFFWKRNILRQIAYAKMQNEFVGWRDDHVPISYRKSIFKIVYQTYSTEFNKTFQNKFRSKSDISHLLVRYWQLGTHHYTKRVEDMFGKFIPINKIKEIDIYIEEYKILCINDVRMDPAQSDFLQDELVKILERKYEEQN
ncbi:stealth conserved region 3 domain-containing protein [Weissella cibaria]|uniref:stealth conserved region 3 domain-containing protein n=1 Tax=Weissella cibaria TaxID=137591 RepID=UPI00189C2E9C|nr:stealth conserved region 3 domain-containing protein [Weissella cibaria]